MSRISTPEDVAATGATGLFAHFEGPMTFILNRLANSWLTRQDLDYHILRASMVIIFLFFGYQKWFEYEQHYKCR